MVVREITVTERRAVLSPVTAATTKGSLKVDGVRFTPDAEWTGYVLTVLFTGGSDGLTYPVLPGADGVAVLPDAIAQKRGDFRVTLVGVCGDKRLVSTAVRLTVQGSGYSSETTAAAVMTPTLVEQLIQRVTEAEASVAAVKSAYDTGELRGADGSDGADGVSPVVRVGSVETLSHSAMATVTQSGTDAETVLLFGIPRGAPGADGVSPVVRVGSVETLPHDAAATVTQSSTNTETVLRFGIPCGAPGADGLDGADGKDGVSPVLRVSGVDTLPYGEPATVTQSETGTETVFRFGIPCGAPGTDGANGRDGVDGADGRDGTDAVLTTESIESALGHGVADSAVVAALEDVVETQGAMLKAYPIDIRIQGVSLLDNEQVAKIPVAQINGANGPLGVVGLRSSSCNTGITIDSDGYLLMQSATNGQIQERTNARYAFMPSQLDTMVKMALTDGKGAAYTSVEKAAARARIGVDTVERRVALLEEASRGRLYTEEIDSANGCQRTVPSGALSQALVTEIGGKSIVWNQWLTPLNREISTNGISITPNGSTYTIAGTSTGTTWCPLSKHEVSFVSGHTYYIRYIELASHGVSSLGCFSYPINYLPRDTDRCIRTASMTASKLFYVVIPADVTLDNVKYTSFIVDLTQMFGIGYEPTSVNDTRIAAIDAYAAAHPEKDMGKLVESEVVQIESEGVNLFDDTAFIESVVTSKWFYTPISITAGDYAFNVFYTDGSTSDAGNVLSFWDDTHILNGSIYPQNTRYGTIDADTAAKVTRAGVYFNEDQGKTIAGITVVKSKSVPNTYTPYNVHISPIPAAVRATYPLRSAGAVYDSYECEGERWTHVQRVGLVDLGETSSARKMTSSSGVECYRMYLRSDAPSQRYYSKRSEPSTPNIACAMYTPMCMGAFDRDVYNSGTITMAMRASDDYGSNYILIQNPAITDEASAISINAGVIVYYELAEPIVTDITEAMGWDGAVTVESGGTITLKQSGMVMEIPGTVAYLVRTSREE